MKKDTLSNMDSTLSLAAQIAIEQVLAVRQQEKVLIVTNPSSCVLEIAKALEFWAEKAGARPQVVLQPVKSQFDLMEDSVREAFEQEPEVYISISVNKLGKDPVGVQSPYLASDGKSYDSISSYLIHGKKVSRGFWSPGITKETFCSCIPLDYRALKADCAAVAQALTQAQAVRITTTKGTDLWFSVKGRRAFVDDGDFSVPGNGGNLPAGEAFLSPVLFSAQGMLVYDGSISVNEGTLLLDSEVGLHFEKGLIDSIDGQREAKALSQTIMQAEKDALVYEQEGRLLSGYGEIYKTNARALGELGIGLNRLASVCGNMLIDEKALRTCHLAIGQNYDQDGPALIHLDGTLLNPTIALEMEDGEKIVLMENGELNRARIS